MWNYKFITTEKYFFLIITILNLIPVLSGRFFPTMDGAAHLYNSNLINSLLFENNLQTHNFFVLNQEPVPNWTGCLILSFFNFFFPAFFAEKVLLLFYMIGLPFSFRALIKTINPQNYLFSYIIFPFTYSFVFFLGFYNFSIAIIFLFITLNYWIKNEENFLSIKKVCFLFLLITLTYFSHILIFAVLLFLIGLQILIKGTIEIINNYYNIKKTFIVLFRKSGVLILSSFIPLILFIYYFISRPSSGNNTFIVHAELIDWIKNIKPLIALNVTEEEIYTKKLFYLISAIFIIVVYNRINSLKLVLRPVNRDNLSNIIKSIISISDFWLISAISILFLYFKLPDSDGSAGFVSVRLGLLFFILLIIWLSTQNYPRWFGLIVVSIVLYCNFRLNIYYMSATKDLNKIAVECNKASEYVLPNSIVLPLNYSENWLVGHFSNYLGIDKPMIILENYECGTGYFPIKWNEKSIPNLLLGKENVNQFPCLQVKSNSQNSIKKIDYVFILGNIDIKTDSCSCSVRRILLDDYVLVYNTGNCKLYKINKD